MKAKKKVRIASLESQCASFRTCLSNILDRLDDLEIRIDEATPKLPECGKTEECEIRNHIRKAMDESKAFYDQIQSEIPKWGR